MVVFLSVKENYGRELLERFSMRSGIFGGEDVTVLAHSLNVESAYGGRLVHRKDEVYAVVRFVYRHDFEPTYDAWISGTPVQLLLAAEEKMALFWHQCFRREVLVY